MCARACVRACVLCMTHSLYHGARVRVRVCVGAGVRVHTCVHACVCMHVCKRRIYLPCTKNNEIVHEVVDLRSYDIIFLAISATLYLCYMQCFGCGCVIMLGFPPIVYPSSNWRGYLRCSHVWRSSYWRSRL